MERPVFGPGRKDDSGKIRVDLLPAGAVRVALAISTHEQDASENVLLWRSGNRDLDDGAPRIGLVAACLLRALADELGSPSIAPALVAVARVLTFGAEKYGANNWQNVTPFEDRYYAALLRHLFARNAGEQYDPESGLPHLAHAACCALFLLSGQVGHDAA